jgi:outer membrane receptor protein involved in Fe transport
MRIYIGLLVMAALSIGRAAYAQTSNATTQEAAATSATTQPQNTTLPAVPANRLENVVVTSTLDQALIEIAPSLGAVTYTIGPDQIQSIPQGEDAPFQQILLRAPGVVMDSFGQEHVRGEHGNLTYRVNGVLLPEGLNGFSQELDSHLIQSVTLIDGSLPAQFGFHTAGIVDVTTKSGETLRNNEIAIYGGSYDTFQPSIEFGGVSGKWDYFLTASYKHDDIGIENPTNSFRPIHDATNQQKAFAYLSYHIDDTSRVSLLLNGSYADFQIPNTAGVAPAFPLVGQPFFDSAALNENQNEQDYYSVLAYQKTLDNLSFQLAGFSRFGQIHFKPDPVGDLIFQGVAGEVMNNFFTNGLQFDSSYILSDHHTLRGGFLAENTLEKLNTNTAVFDTTGALPPDVPFSIVDKSTNESWSSGIYLQDEWRLARDLTLNYGARYDRFDANFDTEDQWSPRANLVWKIDAATTAHAGYSRYFVPPPPQNLNSGSLAKFAGTTNAPENFLNSPPRVERSNYYDVGISRQITRPWEVSVDGFYKSSKQLIDQGQFGAPVILSTFNYETGSVYGAELGSNYKQDGLSAFGNFSWVMTNGRDIDSQQFLFGNNELAFIQDHNIKLDHEAEFTVSTGVSYEWKDDRVYVDMLYSSGLRHGFANQLQEQQYYPVNVGYEHVFHPNGSGKNVIKLRFDVVNLFDESYQLRDGTGVGVGAPQFGQRRGIFMGVSYDF